MCADRLWRRYVYEVQFYFCYENFKGHVNYYFLPYIHFFFIWICWFILYICECICTQMYERGNENHFLLSSIMIKLNITCFTCLIWISNLLFLSHARCVMVSSQRFCDDVGRLSYQRENWVAGVIRRRNRFLRGINIFRVRNVLYVLCVNYLMHRKAK